MVINNDLRLRQLIILHNRHIMILIAQVVALFAGEVTVHDTISLMPRITHIPLLPIIRNIIIQRLPLIRIMREIAELIHDMLIPSGVMRAGPRLAHAAAPVVFPAEIEAAVFPAGLETGVFVVDGFGAEVLEDEGGVEVVVVVVELEVVRFVVFGVGEIHAVAAVAEGADEVVAVVGGSIFVGEALDDTDVGVFSRYVDGGDGGDEGDHERDQEHDNEAEASGGEALERMHC